MISYNLNGSISFKGQGSNFFVTSFLPCCSLVVLLIRDHVRFANAREVHLDIAGLINLAKFAG